MATANLGGKKLEVVDEHAGQFQYQGRWVDKEHFRAFVYNDKDEQKLADNYLEFDAMISSGLWFSEKKKEVKKDEKEEKIEISHKRKPRDGTLRANSN